MLSVTVSVTVSVDDSVVVSEQVIFFKLSCISVSVSTSVIEQALCMLHCAPYNNENAKKYAQMVDNLKNFEICYMENPMEPIIISNLKINNQSFRYKRYSSKKGLETAAITNEDSNRFRLVNYAQAIDFINSVYLPCDPYSNLFDEKNTSSLGRWLKSSKASLLDAPDTKRVIVTDSGESENVRFRDLFVIKDKFIVDTLKNITTYMHDYQQYIKSLKEQNFCIIGYARKSNGSEKEEVRADGDTGDMLRFVNTQKKVCLVAIDHAGLSTNTEDLRDFVRLPLNYLPGQDILSKRILNNQRVINLITTSLLQLKIDTYSNAATEWRNRTHCDVLYLPEILLRNSFPPILIEVQQNVNELFMRRLMMYSLNVVSTHVHSPLPIVLIFCINKVTPQALLAKFTPLPDMPWMKYFPCDLWAKNCYLVSNQPLIESDAALDSLHALSLFLAEQQPALFRHSQPEDKTIRLLYKIAKNVAIEDNLYEANFTTQVDTICSTNHNILTKIKKAMEHLPNSQRACRIVNRGLTYNLKVKRRLILLESTSDSSIDYPDNLPMASVSASPSTNEKEKAFIKRFRKNHIGRINWTHCLEQGHNEGLFRRYSTGDSLRTNFGEYVIQNTLLNETHP
ncbi:hypothetical protein G6F29_008452 [Rhizopus arrhizus]|nr:hypothetical protein G6F30_008034 [Rhizopus arrhizus]KAG0979610.1 hypothetical protein G6F29_008452 [Rhizopus arrhizus]KAG0992191.1 hypothetical protein G6F28_007877 [Rhizopus arrhizus]KAG1006313.1 hypothetical protein G6F27_008423 [Rhizopus arrhizus]KAG1021565.1 hypothetical protein G6F26_008354 [Rhizopus arrhizus]